MGKAGNLVHYVVEKAESCPGDVSLLASEASVSYSVKPELTVALN